LKSIACAHDDHLGKEKILQQPISTVTVDMQEYNIFRITDRSRTGQTF